MDDASHQAVQLSAFQHFGVIVLGARITGLVAASIVASRGEREVVPDFGNTGGTPMGWTDHEGYCFDAEPHFPTRLAYTTGYPRTRWWR